MKKVIYIILACFLGFSFAWSVDHQSLKDKNITNSSILEKKIPVNQKVKVSDNILSLLDNFLAKSLINIFTLDSVINYSMLANNLIKKGNVKLSARVIETIAVESYKKDKNIDVELIKAISNVNFLSKVRKAISFNKYLDQIDNGNQDFLNLIADTANKAISGRINWLTEKAKMQSLLNAFTVNGVINYQKLATNLEQTGNTELGGNLIEIIAVESYKKDKTIDVGLIEALTPNSDYLRKISKLISFDKFKYEIDGGITLLLIK